MTVTCLFWGDRFVRVVGYDTNTALELRERTFANLLRLGMPSPYTLPPRHGAMNPGCNRDWHMAPVSCEEEVIFSTLGGRLEVTVKLEE